MRYIDYAKAGITPEAPRLRVFFNGEEDTSGCWIEINVKEGWGLRYVRPFKLDPETGGVRTQRVRGTFQLLDEETTQ